MPGGPTTGGPGAPPTSGGGKGPGPATGAPPGGADGGGRPKGPATPGADPPTDEEIRRHFEDLKRIQENNRRKMPWLNVVENACSADLSPRCKSDCACGGACSGRVSAGATVLQAPVYLLRTGTTILTDWTVRGGDYLIAAAELLASSSAKIDVFVFTKNRNDTGKGSNIDVNTSITLTSPGLGYNEWSPLTGIGIKELVRYKFICTVQNPAGPNPSALFRMIAPIWFDAIAAPP